MKIFSVKLKIYKYSKLRYRDEEIFSAKNKLEAKKIAKNFTSSNDWAFDLTPLPDLRTIKQIH